MSRIKVLHFPLRDPYGGIEKYILSHWEYMNQEEFEFHLITRFSPSKEFVAAVGKHAHIIPVLGTVQGNESSFFDKMEDIFSNGYDIVHFQTSNWFGGFPLEELARRKGIPRIIVHSHSAGLDPCYVGGEYEKLLQLHEQNKQQVSHALATDFWACSQLAADWLFPKSIAKEKIQIMRNAINLPRFNFCPEVRADYRERLSVKENLVIGVVARFAEQKNPFFLLRIFREIYLRNQNARLVWAGGGPLYEKVMECAVDLKDAVLFLKERQDIPELLQAFDCMLLPSLFEGFPIVAVEAQAAGLPCFLSDTITSECDLTGLVHFLSLSMSPEKWAEEILAGVENTARRDTREILTAKGYNLPSQTRRLEKLYKGEACD